MKVDEEERMRDHAAMSERKDFSSVPAALFPRQSPGATLGEHAR